MLKADEHLSDEELEMRWNSFMVSHPYECCICFNTMTDFWKSSSCSHPDHVCENCWVQIIYTSYINRTDVCCPICRLEIGDLELFD